MHCLISGGAKGIGRGLTRSLLCAGHKCFILDSDTAELSQTSGHLASSHPDKFKSRQCDLRCAADIKASVRECSEFFGARIDLLVNNAAYTRGMPGTPLEHLPLDEWNASLETNLTGPMLLSQACLPFMKARSPGRAEGAAGGSVVMVSSTRAYQSEPDSEAYAATKAGLLGLSQAMAVSLAPVGVRVNAVVLGWIHVENENAGADEKGLEWEEGLTKDDHEWHLTGRVGRVEDVAKAVLYLAGADGVSGTEMFVDGGVSRKMVYPA